MRRSTLSIALLVALAALPVKASAQGASREALELRLREGPSVADLVAYANQHNPSIRAAREVWRATVEGHRVATAYPDPELMFEENNPLAEKWMVRVTQTVPFPGKLSRAGDVVEAEARIARLRADAAARDVALQIREAYHELQYVRAARGVIRSNQDLVDQIRKVGETATARDRATLVDVAKAQSQVAQLAYDGLLMEELEQTQTTRLNALLSRAPDAPLGPLAPTPPLPLAYRLEEIYRIAEQHQEEILAGRAEVDRAQREVSLMRYERLPDFSFGVRKDPLDEGGQDAIGFQVGMTLPLWPGKNAGRVARAEASVEAARARVQTRVDETRTQVREAYFRLTTADRLVRLYRDELLPQAANSMELGETWYRQGQGSFSDFVETESVYYNFQLALARAGADYGKSLARLERLAGRGLTVREGDAAPGSRGEPVP
jgi:outer membrane protein TolC